MPLEALHEAHDMIENGDVQGKIIIDPSANRDAEKLEILLFFKSPEFR